MGQRREWGEGGKVRRNYEGRNESRVGGMERDTQGLCQLQKGDRGSVVILRASWLCKGWDTASLSYRPPPLLVLLF